MNDVTAVKALDVPTSVHDDLYYVSTGRDTKMYTLRVVCRDMARVAIPGAPGEFADVAASDFYVRNLSTDWTKAIEKARAYVEALGGRLADVAEFDLYDIRRRKQEEIDAANAQREAEYEAERNRRANYALGLIAAGNWPFGKYAALPFDAAPRSYVMYWVSQASEDLEAVAATLVAALVKKYPGLANMPEAAGEYLDANVGDRIEREVTLVDEKGFEGFYGYTYVLTFVTAEGVALTYLGSSSLQGVDLGDRITLRFTVKEFGEYRGVKQTKIARPMIPKAKKSK